MLKFIHQKGENNMKKGQIIKQLRKQRHLSAEQLAEKIGIAPATMYRYENGELSKIPDVTIIRIADALGVSKLTLMDEDIDMSLLDAENKANWIKEELIRMRITDEEFDLIEQYIDFLQSRRK
jgi:transcriptional regulator with XRE-family HTH domain